MPQFWSHTRYFSNAHASSIAILLFLFCSIERAGTAADPVPKTAPRIDAPSEVLSGDPVQIRIDGLDASTIYTVIAERWYGSSSPTPRRSWAVYRSDANGIIDVTTDPPIDPASSYTGVEKRGLFWSMRRVSKLNIGQDDVVTSALSPLSAPDQPDVSDPVRLTLWKGSHTFETADQTNPAQSKPDQSKSDQSKSDRPRATPNSSATVRPLTQHILKVVRRPGSLVETPLDSTLAGSFVLVDKAKTTQRDQGKPAPIDPSSSRVDSKTIPTAATSGLPCVILLGGSSGDDTAIRFVAPAFASRGIAAIGVPYYSPGYRPDGPKFPSLPQAFAHLPIDHIERVLQAIDRRPDLDGNRVAIWGVSKGGEYALLAASLIPRFKAVVAVVPSDVVWEGWGSSDLRAPYSGFSWRGKPLPFVPYYKMQETILAMRESRQTADGNPPILRIPHDQGRSKNPDTVAGATIAVERIQAPVLVVGGDADQVWDSGGMCRNIRDRRQNAGLTTVCVTHPDANHYLSGDGFTPNPPGNAAVREKAFDAMMRMLRQQLDL
ncbi:MAG: acyl-CoA thioesterase/bile acid-CoA:amino acid N-acyltransferase family protein [Planctomycetota bacterium]